MLFTLFERIKTDTSFRIKLLLLISFIFNIAYSVFLFVAGERSSSKCFIVTSVYYGLLSLTRIFVFLQLSPKKQLIIKIKTMRACGIFLLLINVTLSAMMFLLLYASPAVQHHEITVIALAAYTFSALTLAITSCIKYFKKKDHVYSCIKIISLVSASVSMVTLTNTMLATWGEENMLLRSIILSLLSGAVSVFIIITAILMIRKANLDLRILKNEQQRK